MSVPASPFDEAILDPLGCAVLGCTSIPHASDEMTPPFSGSRATTMAWHRKSDRNLSLKVLALCLGLNTYIGSAWWKEILSATLSLWSAWTELTVWSTSRPRVPSLAKGVFLWSACRNRKKKILPTPWNTDLNRPLEVAKGRRSCLQSVLKKG